MRKKVRGRSEYIIHEDHNVSTAIWVVAATALLYICWLFIPFCEMFPLKLPRLSLHVPGPALRLVASRSYKRQGLAAACPVHPIQSALRLGIQHQTPTPDRSPFLPPSNLARACGRITFGFAPTTKDLLLPGS